MTVTLHSVCANRHSVCANRHSVCATRHSVCENIAQTPHVSFRESGVDWAVQKLEKANGGV